METKKKKSYNIYRNNESTPKLLLKNDKPSSINTPRFKTSYNNSKVNLNIMDKKYTSKRDEILKMNKTIQSQKSSNKFNNDKSNIKKELIPNENVAQTLLEFTYPYLIKKDKEGLIVDLYHVSNEMDEQNNKLEELQQEYNNLISNSLAYKVIIEKILGIDENGNLINKSKENNKSNNDETTNNKIKGKSKSENNLKLTNYAKTENKEFFPKVNPDINDSETAKNNYILISQLKSKRNKMAIKSVFNNEQENSTKLNVLLREKNILTKKLIEKEKKLDKIKNLEKIKTFEESVSKLNAKNNELEELVSYSKELQIEKFETENKISAYNNKIKKYTDEINSINEKYKYNQKELENCNADVEYLQKCIEDLRAKEQILNEEEKQNMNNYKEKIEKESEINNLLEERKIFFDEKQKLEAQIQSLQKQEMNLKKTIEKKNIYIKSYEKENENLHLMIEDYESRRNKLLERADQPRKNRQRMKDIENEIKTLEQNIVTYKVENNEKENNMEDNVNKNNELIENQGKEIEGHENIIKDLQNQIDTLKNDIKAGEEKLVQDEEKLNKLTEEFTKKEEEYRIEKENKEKEKQEKEMQYKNDEINKNKQNEERKNELIKNKNELNDESEKLKIENEKIKGENANVKKAHQEKFEKYKLINDKMAKLNKILNEIKALNKQ
jgi:hypothetical protein